MQYAPADKDRKRILPIPQSEGLRKPQELGQEASGGFRGVDRQKLKELLELSFGKTLVPGYFDLPDEAVIFGKPDLGVAIVKSAFGEHYLDKFAVHPDHRGNGMAGGLWTELRERYDSLIWRSRLDNPINRWYLKNSDFRAEAGEWAIFAYGLQKERALELAPLIAAIPETFMK